MECYPNSCTYSKNGTAHEVPQQGEQEVSKVEVIEQYEHPQELRPEFLKVTKFLSRFSIVPLAELRHKPLDHSLSSNSER